MVALSALKRAGFVLAAAGVVGLAACGEPPSEPAAAASNAPAAAAPAAPAPAERAKWGYQAANADAKTLGQLTVMLPPGNIGPGRTFTFGDGRVMEVLLTGTVDTTKPLGGQPVATVLGVTEAVLKADATPKTYSFQIISETPPANGAKI